MSSCCQAEAEGSRPPRDYRWLRIGAGAVIAGNSMLLGLAVNSSKIDPSSWRAVNLGLLAAAVLTALLLSPPLLARGFAMVRRGRITTELLFLAGIMAAFAQSLVSLHRQGDDTYFEIASLLLVVYSIGAEVNRGVKRRALKALERLSPRHMQAKVVADGETRVVQVDRIVAGDIVRLEPRATIPVDGTITAGSALVREAELTGEAIARRKRKGDAVIAGTLLLDASVDVRVEQVTNRHIDRIAEAIETARARPSGVERAADAMAAMLFPLVVASASLTLFGWGLVSSWSHGVENALAVVLVACPCALGFATPLVMWSTAARLAKRGIELRSGEAIEALAATDTAVFDKTGTLTLTDASLVSFEVRDDTGITNLRSLVAAVERCSDHPFAGAFRDLEGAREPEIYRVEELRIIGGRGIEADVRDLSQGRDHRVSIGPASLVGDEQDNDRDEHISVLVDGVHRGTATIAERLRPTARASLAALAQADVELHLLSGDRGRRVSAIADLFETARAEVTPLQKLEVVDSLQAEGKHVLFVGDGVNDGAALAAAHAGLAMAGGTELANEAADGSVTGDLTHLASSILDARTALVEVRALMRYAVAYNAIGVALAAAGFLHPVLAAILMAASSVAVTLRATVFEPDHRTTKQTHPLRPNFALSVTRPSHLHRNHHS